VEDEFLALKRGEKRVQRKAGERIDEAVVAGDRDLNQTELLEIAVQRVRPGIDRDARMRDEAGERAGESVGGNEKRDH